MEERPPLIRIRCEGSEEDLLRVEDDYLSSGGEEVAATTLDNPLRDLQECFEPFLNSPIIQGKRHSAPDVTHAGGGAFPPPKTWLSPLALPSGATTPTGGGSTRERHSLPQLLRSPPQEKRLSAPLLLHPGGSRRGSLANMGVEDLDRQEYRKWRCLNRRRVSEAGRFDSPFERRLSETRHDSGGSESSNLLRMRSFLGQSAPSLSNSLVKKMSQQQHEN
ncbi:unnamed protein product [Meganyctiphanes norvegica]|uniref:Uncharacterized protein n=1 Tax=Meganyctiphanes norvegica TaxID=48144 RepID=A0AAV2RFS5_MEGNR